MAKKKTGKSLRDLESLYGFGENPKGFTAQTPNGTAHAFGTGFNRFEPYTGPEVATGGPWQGRRSTRSGE